MVMRLLINLCIRFKKILKLACLQKYKIIFYCLNLFVVWGGHSSDLEFFEWQLSFHFQTFLGREIEIQMFSSSGQRWALLFFNDTYLRNCFPSSSDLCTFGSDYLE